MSSTTETYTPTKPAAAHSDDEVREGPDFRNLRSVMPETIPDETVLGLARQSIEARWVSIRDNRRDELVELRLMVDAARRRCDRQDVGGPS